ncbi:LexA family protein [Variovorax boronicumulans]|uniref:LexA family protein n=1 Tax=Variovorax boronicumulans TaxID=436515 RepID=UPI0012E57EEA|nr:S24 family peptidase [Variovorax boronicumulans]GER16720.1 peptidase S24 [Variovorax boronicumulans]
MKTWTPEQEAERLAARFEGVNQAKFAREHQVPGGPSMVSQHIKKRRPLNLEAAVAYAKGFGVPLAEISPRLAAEVAQAESTSHANTEATYGSRGDVPLISWIQAGDWNDAADPFQPGDAEDWIPCVRRHSSSSYALRVRGDSMTAAHGNTRTYPKGCIVFVDPEKRSPVNGERIIAKLSGPHTDVTFKVFKQEDGRTWLQPINPTHLPIYDEFKVLGTVIGKWEDE